MIQGKKVKLRAVEQKDLPQVTAALNDPGISMPLGGHYFAISLRCEEKWYDNYLANEYQLSSLVIENLQTGEYMGNIGFNDISWKNRKATVGLFLNRRYWSQGYGTDALMALCHFGFTQLNLQRIQLFVYETNKRGIRSYEKCGFQVEVVQKSASYVDGEYVDDLIMGVLVEEFMPIYENYVGNE